MATIKKTQLNSRKTLAPHKLMLLVTVVPREKAEFFVDLIQSFEANVQLSISSFGTAGNLSSLLNVDVNKQTVFSIIRKDMENAVLSALSNKFSTIRNGKGVAFTVPLTSTVGVAVYRFLSNKQQ